jgi:hypothetical protein
MGISLVDPKRIYFHEGWAALNEFSIYIWIQVYNLLSGFKALMFYSFDTGSTLRAGTVL